MLFIYRGIINFLYAIVPLLIVARVILNKEDKERYKEKLYSSAFKISRDFKKKLIWIHVASIGEYKSIIPVIDKLNRDYQFLITSVTLSSANIISKDVSEKKNITHRFFPIDKKSLVEKFLNGWKPNMAIFVDSEIWPNFLLELKKKKIPLVLLNARITNKTFNRWMMVPTFAKEIFSTFDLCLTSNQETVEHLKKLNARNIKFFGNLKFAGAIDIDEIQNENKEIFNKKKVWCAASTHKGEEEFCLKAHSILKKKYKDLITIIIPRHIDRSNDINTLCKNKQLSSQIISGNELIRKENEIIIINDFNVLTKYFKYSKSVFIGKSILKKLEKVGGQNPIEAAKLGCKIYHGPYVYNFNEIYSLLKDYNIAEVIKNEEELAKKLSLSFDSLEKKNNLTFQTINEIGDKILAQNIEQIKKLHD